MSTIKADNYEATTAGNNLIFKANGTEKMRVSPNVGGTTNVTGVGVGVGSSGLALNTNGTTVHIHEPTAGGASVLHCTNAAQGIGNAKGFICGIWSNNDAYCYTYDPVSLQFGTNSTIKMTITSAGNVGIGTDTPAQKLDVTGTIKASSGLVLGSATFNAPSGTAPIFGCRCFGSIQLTGNAEGGGFTLLTAGNVASIVRRTTNDSSANTPTGGYRITFGTAMPNAFYTVVLGSGRPPSGYAQSVQDDERTSLVYNKTATYFDVYCFNGGGAYYDSSINWAVFA